MGIRIKSLIPGARLVTKGNPVLDPYAGIMHEVKSVGMNEDPSKNLYFLICLFSGDIIRCQINCINAEFMVCEWGQKDAAGEPFGRHYLYTGDRLTDPALKNQACRAVLQASGKCIRGRNGNMLVQFDSGQRAVVIARLLRKDLRNYNPFPNNRYSSLI